MTHLRWGALAVSAIGLAVLFGWDAVPEKRKPKWLPAPLLVVTLGVLVNLAFGALVPDLRIGTEHLVALPTGGPAALLTNFRFPDLTRITSALLLPV